MTICKCLLVTAFQRFSDVTNVQLLVGNYSKNNSCKKKKENQFPKKIARFN